MLLNCQFLLSSVAFAWARLEHFGASNLLTSFFLPAMPFIKALLEVS